MGIKEDLRSTELTFMFLSAQGRRHESSRRKKKKTNNTLSRFFVSRNSKDSFFYRCFILSVVFSVA